MEKSSSRGLSEKNGSWGASANGHEAFQTLAGSRARCSGNLGPHRRGQRQSRPPSSSPDFDACQRIAENPGIGHRREDLTDKPVLFWPAGSYLIIYNPARKPVEI